MDLVRGLIIKYPFMLSKTQAQLDNVFTVLGQYGLSEQETMKFLFECPKLVSVDLAHQIKEILFLFDLYHKMTEEQVFEIFRTFPYVFCVDTYKIKQFLGQFKKYKLT